MPAKVILELCPQDHKCPAVRFCPTKALSQEGNLAPVIDEDACNDCGRCVRVCPLGALKLFES